MSAERRRPLRAHRAAGLLLGAALLAPAAAARPPEAAPSVVAAHERVFRAALARVRPSIVRIQTIGGAPPVRADDEAERAAAGFRQADGPTTGVIWSADGLILTSSFNFIRDPSIITVTRADGRRFVARLVARDRHARLALLKADFDDGHAAEPIESTRLRPGQWALAAGFGHGSDEPTLSVGILSALERASGMAVQTDAKISAANYGGPLFDVEGRVVGICVPIHPNDDDEVAGVEWYDSGIGFAITAEHVDRRLPRLLEGRDLWRGLLGVALDSGEVVVGRPARPDDPRAAVAGVRVVAPPVGPAARAGIRIGDIITRLDDEPTPRIRDFRRAVARRAAGDDVVVSYTRDGVESRVPLRLEAADQVAAEPPPPP